MKHLKTGDLVRLTGYSRASIARMARSGQLPGTCSPDGVHFAFEDGDDLRAWIEQATKRKTKFAGGRPMNRAASRLYNALRGGQTFYNQALYLAKTGHTEEARRLIFNMQKSIDAIRQVCDGDSA